MDRFRVIAAVHLLLVRESHVLMLRRCNTGYEDGNYSVPAGHLDGGETVTSATAREALEECGIVILPEDLRVVGVMHRRGDDAERIDFFLTAQSWSGEVVNAEPQKCDELHWYALDALPDNTVGYVRAALAQDHADMWYREFGWD